MKANLILFLGIIEYCMFKKSRDRLSHLPIRFAASFIFSTSATFFNMIYNEVIFETILDENNNNSTRTLASNVMVKSIPDNYHGFSALCKNKIKINKISPAKEIIPTNYFEGLDFLDETNKQCLYLFLKEHLVTRYADPSIKQLSLLISLGAIWINDNQDSLSQTILMVVSVYFL